MANNGKNTIDARTGSVNYNGPSEITLGNHYNIQEMSGGMFRLPVWVGAILGQTLFLRTPM